MKASRNCSGILCRLRKPKSSDIDSRVGGRGHRQGGRESCARPPPARALIAVTFQDPNVYCRLRLVSCFWLLSFKKFFTTML